MPAAPLGIFGGHSPTLLSVCLLKRGFLSNCLLFPKNTLAVMVETHSRSHTPWNEDMYVLIHNAVGVINENNIKCDILHFKLKSFGIAYIRIIVYVHMLNTLSETAGGDILEWFRRCVKIASMCLGWPMPLTKPHWQDQIILRAEE